jgi:hypothetical protein
LLTYCHQIYVRKEIFRPCFLDVSRQGFRNPIDFIPCDLRRVFLCYVHILICILDDNVSSRGLYGGLYGQNLPYKCKNSHGDFRNRNFEKSHRNTGPSCRSDLRPDSWFRANSDLDPSFAYIETESFWVTIRAQGCRAHGQYPDAFVILKI